MSAVRPEMYTAQQGSAPSPIRGGRRALDETSALHAIVEGIADGIVIVGTDGLVLFANPAAAALLGRSPSHLVGAPFGFPLTTATGQEIDIIVPPGPMGAAALCRVAELRVASMGWYGGTAYVVSLRDITERKEAAERARQLAAAEAARMEAERGERDARFVAESGVALARTLDAGATIGTLARLAVPDVADWCVVHLVEGDAMRLVATAQADPSHAVRVSELWCARALEALHRRLVRTTEAGGAELAAAADCVGSVSAGVVSRAQASGLASEVAACPVIVAPLVARGVLGLLTVGRTCGSYDERDAALFQALAGRAALALSNAQLFESTQQANQAKAEFLAVMSHELRTPLNAIGGYAQLLAEGIRGPVTDTQRNDLERIQRSQRHLLRMIEEILDFARIEKGVVAYDLAPVRVEDVLSDVRTLIGPQLEAKGLAYDESGPPEALARADRRKLGQVLLNLLSNAIKFTERGGTVVVRWTMAQEVTISVRDTGIGIPPSKLAGVFDPFVQVDQGLTRAREGAGLGLAISRQLARGMGGDLTVTSTTGVGSTFALMVPGA